VLFDVELKPEDALVVDVKKDLEGVAWLFLPPLHVRDLRTSNVRLGKKEDVVLFCGASG